MLELVVLVRKHKFWQARFSRSILEQLNKHQIFW